MENKYKHAAELGCCDSSEERTKLIERVEILIKYRGNMAKQILDNIDSEDKELLDLLKHMYEHYDDLIKQSLAL